MRDEQNNNVDHYFSAQPASAAQMRVVSVPLGGRQVEVEVAAGVFSPSGVDKGTSVLLRYAVDPPSVGDLLDLGCGWGPIALTMAMLSPGARVWAVDVNERALDLTRRNAQRLGLDNVHAVLPHDVPSDVNFAAIWSNPPIRVGKAVLHQMLTQWLTRLAPQAPAWMVVQKNLGADSLSRWLEAELSLEVTREASSKGFRILHAIAGSAPPVTQ